MSNHIGETIYRYRRGEKLTQDQLGSRFDLCGPAIFKFEQGVVRPSLRVWLRISSALKISERKAILMWVKDGLPERFQHMVDLKHQVILDVAPEGYDVEDGIIDYSTIHDRDRLRQTALEDDFLPRGLKSLIRKDDTWALYKPTGDEINFLRDIFGRFPRSTRALFREALILHRQFSGKE